MVHGGVIDIVSGQQMRRSLHRHASDYRENLCHDRVCTSTVLVRRAALDRAGGFDESFRAMGDWDLWTRLMRAGRVDHLCEPLTVAWLRDGSIQRGSIDVFAHFHRLALEKRSSELDRHGLTRKAEAAHQYAVAAKLSWRGEYAEARGRLSQSLRARPSAEALALLAILSLPPKTRHRTRMRLRTIRGLLAR
jgi:hypothetical protein